MSKVKILVAAVVVLVLVNISLVAFIMLRHGPPHPGKKDPKMMIIERLDFDPAQVQVYKGLILEHKSAIAVKGKEMMKLRQELYGLLGASDRSEANTLISRIGKQKAEIETVHFNHFHDIEAICHEDQKTAFKELSMELGRIFNMPPPPKRR